MPTGDAPVHKSKFLIVDDDAAITKQLAKVVESLGHEAVTFTDPVAAAGESHFDIVMVDFMMPQLSGVDLLDLLKVRNPHAVRLLLTAASDFKVAVEAVNRGEVFRLLAKPWQLGELKVAISQAVDMHRLMAENRRLQRELHERNEALTRLNITLEERVVERTNGLLDGMIRALDTRDTETQWHSRRVSFFTRRIAEAVGVTGQALMVIEQGALLHDIGKIGVKDSILLKPGPLSPEEWVEMRLHPEIGFRMLQSMPYLAEAAQIVLQHQERWDGRGYPQGLKGEAIVLGARAFCIADTLDAITSDRPYRQGSPLQVALSEIERLGGTQLDPHMVRTFLSIPATEWPRIRGEVEAMEAAERQRPKI